MNADRNPADYDAARAQMIARDLRGRGIADMRVLEAFDAVHRHRFIPDVAPRDAYGDFPFSIGLKQTVSQPYIVALMVELAGIRSGDRVLEIGTGCGFQTAILAHLTPEVFTVEIIPELLERARAMLVALGCETVRGPNRDRVLLPGNVDSIDQLVASDVLLFLRERDDR
jgi:protein-L-isoaspartate(D-aspartate) O-methyltransferase